MNILIIGNPIAGGGKGERNILRLQSILEKRGHGVTSYLTRFAGDGRNRISRVTPEVDRIVIVGGDGTVNEIISGIPRGFSTPILQMPMGNANLLGKDLQLPGRAVAVAELLEKGRVVMADVAQMNGKTFIMVAGAGFDARVTQEMKKTRQGRVSNFSYIMPIFRALKHPFHSRFEVVVDGAWHARGDMVLVCNVRNFAGLCDIAFDAGVNTGQLDVVVFPDVHPLSLFKYGVFSKFSRVTRLKGVKYLKGKTVEMDSTTPIPIELDGDFNGWHHHVSIRLKPERIPLVVPPAAGLG